PSVAACESQDRGERLAARKRAAILHRMRAAGAAFRLGSEKTAAAGAAKRIAATAQKKERST
ncbi:MAG: hypothetical protein WCF64_00660, partial [Methylocella sp.]